MKELKLKQALSDEKDIPARGGTIIGFGFFYKHPLSKSKGNFKRVLDCLKGSDSAPQCVCASLGLELNPKVIYKAECLDLDCRHKA